MTESRFICLLLLTQHNFAPAWHMLAG